MGKFALSNSLTRNMVEIILKYLSNNINNTLYFLGVRLWSLTESEKLYHSLREYNFTDFEIDLIVFKDIDFINKPFDSNILEYSDYKIDYL